MIRCIFCALLGSMLAALTLNGCGSTSLVQGPPGPEGKAGKDAISCTINSVSSNLATPNGGALIQCPDGTQSLILNGTNGTNGTVITPIKFCPGTSSYPSTFVELGFCINNSIYAVYSANDGFLTEILPGTWSSNAINSQCTFIVGPNCSVTN